MAICSEMIPVGGMLRVSRVKQHNSVKVEISQMRWEVRRVSEKSKMVSLLSLLEMQDSELWTF
jgi:hypothetical protein